MVPHLLLVAVYSLLWSCHAADLDQKDAMEALKEMHATQLASLEAKHDRQMRLLQLQLNEMRSLLLPDHVKDMKARHLAEVGDMAEYSGLKINTDEALIAMGAEADVKLVRTGFGTLEALVDTYQVHGDLHVQDLYVNGTNIRDLCSCSDSDSDSGDVVSVKVETLTGTAENSESNDIFYVAFYIPSLGTWTDELQYFSGTSIGSIQTKTFQVPDVPSKLRFTLSGEDAWGIAQVAVWVDDGPEMVVLCSGVVGDNPDIGDNGHWIDGNGDGGAPTSVEMDFVDACQSTVSVTAHTGTLDNSESSDTIYLSFLVEGTWTSALPFFTGTSKGDIETEVYGLAADPTEVTFTISGTDAWGFDYLEVVTNNDTFVVSCVGAQTSMSSTSEHWVDGDASGGVTDELILDIEHTNCTTHSVRVEALTGTAENSASDDTFYVEFYLPEADQWSGKFVFFTATSAATTESATFYMAEIPSALRFSLSGTDAWGIGQVAVWIDDGPEIVILCTGVVGDNPDIADNGHWIDGNGDGGAPTTLELAFEPACSDIASLTAVTGTLTNSDSSDTVYVSFNIDGVWTTPEPFFSGSSVGDSETELYGLNGVPTQIAFTISGSNAWGFDYLEIVLDDEVIVLSCTGTQSSMSSSSDHWVDGDGSNGVTDELVLDIVNQDC